MSSEYGIKDTRWKCLSHTVCLEKNLVTQLCNVTAGLPDFGLPVGLPSIAFFISKGSGVIIIFFKMEGKNAPPPPPGRLRFDACFPQGWCFDSASLARLFLSFLTTSSLETTTFRSIGSSSNHYARKTTRYDVLCCVLSWCFFYAMKKT